MKIYFLTSKSSKWQNIAFLTKMLSYFRNFLRKTNSYRNLRKKYFNFLNFKLKNKLKFKIKLTKKNLKTQNLKV